VRPDELSERLLELAARVGKVVDALPDTGMGRHVAGHLVRCGTSPAPNYEEACAGESRANFIHKMKIALKELREARYWLKLIVRTKLQPAKVIDESNQHCNIFGQSVVTAKGIKPKQKEPKNEVDRESA
jgi:four helix bundle protein